MKIGIDSYCYHRFFGEVYPNQKPAARPYSMDSVLDRAKDLGCDGVSLESCFFPEFGERYLTGLRRKSLRAFAIYYLSADLQSSRMFKAREPLRAGARRAGWQGFAYDLTVVPVGAFVRVFLAE